MPTATFPPKFLRAFLPIDAVNMRTKFEVCSLTIPEISGGA